jgi:predicted TIM-barrel fold metal-dependent hydrolase
MNSMRSLSFLLCGSICLSAASPALRATGAQSPRSASSLAPILDAHQHLRSPAAATNSSDLPPAKVTLPPELDTFLQARIKAAMDKPALAALYTARAWLLQSFDPAFIQTRDSIADWWTGATDSPYGLDPIGYGVNGSAAFITAYLTDLKTGHRDAHVALSLTKENDGRWRITTETLTMGGPRTVDPVAPDYLVSLLDSAQIRRALVMSIAYQFGPDRDEKPGEYSKVRAENDWTAEQAAKFPDRLRAFCSFNPLRSYALEELDRCAKSGRFRGIKLHFGNSGVDFSQPADLDAVMKVFRAANERKLPIIVHFAPRGGVSYGRAFAETFFDKVLPGAPDIPIQIAHLASQGRLDTRSDSALSVFVERIAARDQRANNLWFDVATAVTPEISATNAARVAARIRQLGVGRILYGSDTPDKDHLTPRKGWAAFHDMLPLTEAEFRTIANNIPSYGR